MGGSRTGEGGDFVERGCEISWNAFEIAGGVNKWMTESRICINSGLREWMGVWKKSWRACWNEAQMRILWSRSAQRPQLTSSSVLTCKIHIVWRTRFDDRVNDQEPSLGPKVPRTPPSSHVSRMAASGSVSFSSTFPFGKSQRCEAACDRIKSTSQVLLVGLWRTGTHPAFWTHFIWLRSGSLKWKRRSLVNAVDGKIGNIRNIIKGTLGC